MRASSVVDQAGSHRLLAFLVGSRLLAMLAIGIACALFMGGTRSIPLVLLALAPWPLVLVKRLGWSLAIAAVLALATGGALVLAAVARPMGIPLAVVYGSSLTAVGAAGWWLAVRALTRQQVTRPRASAWWVLAPASTWVLLVAVAEVVPGASRVSWAMQGDAANDVLFARDILEARGVELGGTNPVPMMHVLLSVVFAPQEMRVPRHAQQPISRPR